MSGAALAELASLDQWVTWKFVTRNDKCDKVPFEPISGDPASSSNLATWSSYGDAFTALARFDGLGFVFSEYDPYSGVDFDGCRNPESGEIAPWAQRWIRRLNSYTEISPSGTGVKVWVSGVLPASVVYHAGPHVGIEIYSKGRYFCVTGQHLAGTPTTINDAQAELTHLGAVLSRAKRRKKRPTKATPSVTRTEPRVSPGERAAGRLSAKDTIARANRDNDLGALLERHGATLVGGTASERQYSGLAGDQHDHKTTYKVSAANDGNGQIGYSYSPNGKLNRVDFDRGFRFFDALVELEYAGDTLATLKALTPDRPKRAPLPEPEYRTVRQDRDAQHKRKQRREQNHTDLAAIEQRLCQEDDQLSDRARVLGAYLLELSAHEHLQVRPTNEQLAAALTYSQRTIVYAFRDLEAAGYGKRTGGKGGLDQPNQAATWTWFRPRTDVPRVQRVSPIATPETANCTLIDHVSDLDIQPVRACEGGAIVEPDEKLDVVAAFDCFEPEYTFFEADYDQNPESEADQLSAYTTDAEVTIPSAITPPSHAPVLQVATGFIDTPPAGEWVSFEPDALLDATPLAEHEKPASVRRLGSLAPITLLDESTVEVAEQQQLGAAPTVLVLPTKTSKSKHTSYRAEVGQMSPLELAHELGRLQGILRSPKVVGKPWAKDYREKLSIVDAEIELRDSPGADATQREVTGVPCYG